MFRTLWFALLLGVPTTHAYSQTIHNDTVTLTLSAVMKQSEIHSKVIKKSHLSTQIEGAKVVDQKLSRLPDLGISASYERASNLPVYDNGLLHQPAQFEVIHDLYKVNTDFFLNIYNGNKQNLSIQSAKIMAALAEVQHEKEVADIHLKAALYYLELQKSILFKQVIENDIKDQEQQLKEIKAFNKHGVVLKSDVLRVELDLSKRKLTLVQIENDILLANQQLNILIGLPDEKIVQPTLDLNLKHELPSYDACIQAAYIHAFDYHISEKGEALAAQKLKFAKANVLPTVSMYGNFWYSNPQIFLYPYSPSWYSLGIVGVKASFPISALYKNKQKVNIAKFEIEKESINHHDVEDQIRIKVKNAYLRYKESLVQIDVATSNVDRALENSRIIKQTYFNSASLITDLLDADIQVLQSQFELTAAKILAQNKFFVLQNTIGIF